MSIASIAWGVISSSNRALFSAPSETDPYSDQVVFFAPMQDTLTHYETSDTVMLVSNPTTAYLEPGGGPFGDACLYAGSGGYLLAALALDVQAADFTIEGWVKTTAGAFTGVAAFNAITGSDINLLTMTGDYIFVSSNASWWNVLSLDDVSYGIESWTHFAFTRNNTEITFWVNGIAEATASVTSGTSFTYSGPWTLLGKKANALYDSIVNRIAHMRVTKGVCRYPAAFAPPTGPFPTPTKPTTAQAKTTRRFAVMGNNPTAQTLRRFTILTS